MTRALRRFLPRRGRPGQALGLLGLGALLCAAPAQAQMTAGTCSGTVGGTAIAGTLYLNVNGTRVATTGGTAGGVFSLSECECSTQDISLEVVMTQAVPMTATGGIAMYLGVGSDCTDSVSRANTCEQIVPESYPTPKDFSDNFSFEKFKLQNNAFRIPLPAQIITRPKIGNSPRPETCADLVEQSRTLTVLIGDVNSSPATCKMSVVATTTPPVKPTSVSTNAGNSAVKLRWQAATIAQRVERYQVLCRDRSQPDVPLKPDLKDQLLFYSVCLDPASREFYRRKNIPGTGATLPTADMASSTGTTSVPDPPESSEKASAGRTADIVPPRGGGRGTDEVDMSSSEDLAAVEDMGPAADMTALSAFERLDPRFLCTTEIRASSATELEVRVDGLTNDHTYEFIVVAIDPYGNPSPSDIVTASPQRTQNLLEAARDAGNYPGGFSCTAGGRAPAGGALGAASLLLLGLGLRRARRGRADRSARSPRSE